MFVPLTEGERQAFLNQSAGSFIPGYTGHCPTLKFQFGRCYGTDTKDIMRRLRDEKVIKDSKVEYRKDDKFGQMVLKPIKRTKDQAIDNAYEISRKEARCILGYTGYIPGMNFRYGKSYGRTVDESMREFIKQQVAIDTRLRDLQIANNPVLLSKMRNEEEVSQALRDYLDRTRFKEKHISPECPPISGYTGHIPRVKSNNELSLSKRYNTVAQQGLAMLQEEQEREQYLLEVDQKMKQLLEEKDKKYYERM